MFSHSYHLLLSFSSYGWFCNTVEELEPLGLEVLRKYIKLAIWAIGLVLPQAMISRPTKSMIHVLSAKKFGKKAWSSVEQSIEWLN